MFMMFSGFRANQVQDVKKVLEKENLQLEDLFLENDFSSWVKNNILNDHMINNPKFMEKMIDYCLLPKKEFLEKYKDELPKKKIEVSKEEEKEEKQQDEEDNEQENKEKEEENKPSEEKEQEGDNEEKENEENNDDNEEKIIKKTDEEDGLEDVNSQGSKNDKKEYRYEDYSEEELQKIMSNYAFNSSEFFNEARSTEFQLFMLGRADKDDENDSPDPNYMGSDSYDECNVNNSSDDQIKQEISEEKKQAEKLKKEEEEKAKLEKGKELMKQILKFLERDQEEVDNYDTRAGYFYKIMSPIQFIGHFLDFLINDANTNFDDFSEKIILKSKNPNIREAVLKLFFEDDKSISNNDQENQHTETHLSNFVQSLFKASCKVVSENKTDTAIVETCCQIVEKMLTWFGSQLVIDENIQSFVDVLFTIQDDQDSIYSLCKLFQNIVEEIDIDPEKNAFAKSFNKIATLIDFRDKKLEPQEYKNQCKQNVLKFGFGNLEIVELLYLIVKSQKVKTEELVLGDSEIFKILHDLIVKFEWNSLVQTSIFKLLQEITKCEDEEVTLKYLKDTDVINFIQDNFNTKTKPGDYKVEVNRGFQGILIKIGFQIQVKRSSSIKLQIYCEEQDWDDFAKKQLFDTLNTEKDHEWGKIYNDDHPEEYEKEKSLQKTPESERKESYLKSLEVNFNQDYLNQRRNMFDDDDEDDNNNNASDNINNDEGLTGGLDKGMKLDDIAADDEEQNEEKTEEKEFGSGNFWKLPNLQFDIDDLLNDI